MPLNKDFLLTELLSYREQCTADNPNKRRLFQKSRYLVDAIANHADIDAGETRNALLNYLQISDNMYALHLLDRRDREALHYFVPNSEDSGYMSFSEYIKDVHDSVLQQLRKRNWNDEISLTDFLDRSMFLFRPPSGNTLPKEQVHTGTTDWMFGMLPSALVRKIVDQKEPADLMGLVFGAYRYGEHDQERVLITDMDTTIRRDWGKVGGAKGPDCAVNESDLTNAIHKLKQIPKNLVYQPVDHEPKALKRRVITSVNMIDDDDAGWNIMSKTDIDIPTTEEDTHEGKNSSEPRLPTNHRNSCYIDSVLVALFVENNARVTSMFLTSILPITANPSQFIYGRTVKEDLEMRQRIQKTLIGIVTQMRHGQQNEDGITNLRRLLGQCRFDSNFDLGDQEDASDFLAVLCQVFNVHDHQNQQTMQVFGSHDLVNTPPKTATLTTESTNSMGIVHHVFDWKPGCHVKDTLSNTLDSRVEPFSEQKFVRATTVTRFMPDSFFAVHVDRTAGGKLNRSPLFTETSIISNGRTFKLMSIVMHMGGSIRSGHYVCLFFKEHKLFLYDDMNQSLTESTFTAEQIAQQCVIIFYSV